MQNESSPNYSNFRPEFCLEFCSEFSPRFLRSLRASFRWTRRQEKLTENPRRFSMQNVQADTKKNSHNVLLESRQSKIENRHFGRKLACGLIDLKDADLVAVHIYIYTLCQKAKLRNAPSTAGNSMTRASLEPFLKKRGILSRTGGERILEMLWSLQMP